MCLVALEQRTLPMILLFIAEYDQCLFAVLDRLREVGLMVNREKWKFWLSKLRFFSHELTKDGINLSEEKVAAIRDVHPPKDASDKYVLLWVWSSTLKVHDRCCFCC